MDTEAIKRKEEIELVKKIQESESNGEVVTTILKTDEKVIARVTDGIYRQPGSAIRELISNAYDADATRVVIKTDAPRFETISIEDDGVGMSPEVISHILYHIGGSAKRQTIGKRLGVTDAEDQSVSPSGRKLIGKIGIGLFSVAQLTHNFQIVTKTKGDSFRTVATVALKQFSDEATIEIEDSDLYESGKVNIWREAAADVDVQGTTIILTNIKPGARDTLQSREFWNILDQNNNVLDADEKQPVIPPKYNIGRVDLSNNQLLLETDGKLSNLPWESNDKPDVAFKKLVQSVFDEAKNSLNPKLETLFDYYLQMVWLISLSIPIKYVEGNLFDKQISSWAEWFEISNTSKGSAKQIAADQRETVRSKLNLVEGAREDTFDVFFDNVKLFRPIRYTDAPITTNAIKTPLVFIGKCKENFESYPIALTTGPLEFEAYLYWNPKIVPTEHQGALIRINGASGTLFDPSFMRYQVAELTRLRQITCEIFVHKGFESSLNIDRESFNYSHPHAVYLARWLHSALRQLATTQKNVASKILQHNRQTQNEVKLSDLQEIALDVWQKESNDKFSSPPIVKLQEDIDTQSTPNADIVFRRSEIISDAKKGPQPAKNQILEQKIIAITQVLISFGALDALTKEKQSSLLKAIYKIMEKD